MNNLRDILFPILKQNNLLTDKHTKDSTLLFIIAEQLEKKGVKID